MVLTLFIAASTFLALLLSTLWVLQGVGRPIDARMRSLAVAPQQGAGLASIPFQQRVVGPAVAAIGQCLAAVLPGAFVRRIEQRLVLAGRPMRPPAFYALVIGLGTALAGAYILLILAAFEGAPPPALLLPSVPLGAVGAFLPVFWLSSRAGARQTTMVRGLPDSLDLLTICVEAGLGLDGALHRVTETQSGPFVDELRQMLREIGIGKTRRQALLDLADRTDIDDVRSFANALIQAEQMGTSLGQVLRVQSQRLRVRRRQRAEQDSRRAPVKMVFPLVFCLMPSLFIFILGPIVVSVVDYLSN